MQLQFDKKLFFLLGLPRSGSSWLGNVLYAYLKKQQNFEVYLDGYFNKSTYFEILNDGTWLTHFSYKPGRFFKTAGFDSSDDQFRIKTFPNYFPMWDSNSLVFAHKLELLKRTLANTLIKQHPNELTSTESKFVLTYPHLILKRRDTWNQLLSFLLSMSTNSFILNRGQSLAHVEQNSITAELLTVVQYLQMIKKLDELVTVDSNILYFEDLPFEDPNILLSNLGLEPILTKDDLEFFPIKQQYGNKERFFSNIEKIKEIYDTKKIY